MLNGKERELYQNTQNEPIILNGKERELYENTQNEPIMLNGKEKEQLENIKNDEFLFKGKEKEPKILENIQNESMIFNGKPKEKEIFENIQNEPIMLIGKEKVNPKETETETEKEKEAEKKREKLELANIQNESIHLKPKKKKTKEIETQIDKDLNSNLIENDNDNFTYEPIKPKKSENDNDNFTYESMKPKTSENIIFKNEDLYINNENNENKNRKELYLSMEQQQPLSIYNDNKYNKDNEYNKYGEDNKDKLNNVFNKDSLSVCYSENFAIKLKEDYESEPSNKVYSENEANPHLNKNINYVPSVEKRLEIIDNQLISSLEKKTKKHIFGDSDELNEDDIPLDKIEDLNPDLAKKLINNMVQDKLEKEKQKNLNQTKNKLMKVIKVIKLKNALGKNLNNKRYFINKLKEIKKIKDGRKLLRPANAISFNYISNYIYKKEDNTNTDNLDNINQKISNTFYIENTNKIQILESNILKTNNQLNDYEQQMADRLNKIRPVKNYSLGILAIESIESEDQGLTQIVGMPPGEEEPDLKNINIEEINSEKTSQTRSRKQSIKIIKIKRKKIIQKEKEPEKGKIIYIQKAKADSFSIISIESSLNGENKDQLNNIKKVETKDESCQTPKLRPPTKAPKKIVFHEIKTIIKKEPKPVKQFEVAPESKYRFSGKKLNQNYEKIKEEKEEEEHNDKMFRIEALKKLLKLYVNKRTETLKVIYWIKWKHISNIKKMEDKNQNKLSKLFNKYPRIFAMKLLNFFDEYCKSLAPAITTKNAVNKETFKILKRKDLNDLNDLKNKKVIIITKEQLNRKKIALEKLNSVLKKNAGKYVFSLYKE